MLMIVDLEIRIIYGKAVLINAYWNAKDFVAIVLVHETVPSHKPLF